MNRKRPTKSTWRQRALLVVVLLPVVAALVVGAHHVVKELDKRAMRRAEAQVAVQIIEHMDLPAGLTHQETMDAVRGFVNAHSVHRISSEFESYRKDPPRMMRMILANATSGEPPPHMECSSRSNVMRTIMTELGYDTRSVVFYRPSEGGYISHTMIEVRHPERDRWQVQDPDFDIHWIRHGSDERVSARELLTAPREAFEPCVDLERCGWDVVSDEGIAARALYDYLAIVSVSDKARDERPLYVNTRRFDWDRAHPAGERSLTFCDYVPKNCRDTIEFYDAD